MRRDLQAKDLIKLTYTTTLTAQLFYTIVAIATQFDLKLRQYNIAGAFLNVSC